MSEQRYTYATIGINDQREEPVIVTGKRNVSFEIGGEEFDRTATLRLPERMTSSEFNQWKSESGVDLIDIYFHCIKQTPRKPEPAPEDAGGEVGEEEQSELVTDGGSDQQPDLSALEEGNEVRVFYRSTRSGNEVKREGTVSEVIPSEENRIVRVHTEEREPLKHIFLCMTEAEDNSGKERVFAFSQTAEPDSLGWEERHDLARPELGEVYTLRFEVSRNSYLGPVDRIVRTDRATPIMMTDGGEEVCPSCCEEGERPPGLGENLRACMNLECRVNEFEVNRTATDGGSSMPKMALEHLKELDATDDKIGEWLSEKVGEPIGGMTDLYASEHSIPDAMNEVELGEGFSLKEPAYIELLTLLDHGREAAASDPPTLGVRNRLLMQLILANPEAYARIRKEMEERAKEAHEEMQQRMNQERERQRMTERAADLDGDAVDIALDDEEDADE